MEAVTTTLRACLPAAMAPAISIHDIILPPKMVPKAFVSDGRTISVIMTEDSRGGFPLSSLMRSFSHIFNERLQKKLFYFKKSLHTRNGGEGIMATSMDGVPGGAELLQMIIEMTGLPPDLVRAEIDGLILKAGYSAESLTLDQFRDVLQAYLEHTASSLMT